MFICHICGLKFATEDGLDNHYAYNDRNGQCQERMDSKEYAEELEFLDATEHMSPAEARRWVIGNRRVG